MDGIQSNLEFSGTWERVKRRPSPCTSVILNVINDALRHLVLLLIIIHDKL